MIWCRLAKGAQEYIQRGEQLCNFASTACVRRLSIDALDAASMTGHAMLVSNHVHQAKA